MEVFLFMGVVGLSYGGLVAEAVKEYRRRSDS
jgi:uncharacterized transporter YbjL